MIPLPFRRRRRPAPLDVPPSLRQVILNLKSNAMTNLEIDGGEPDLDEACFTSLLDALRVSSSVLRMRIVNLDLSAIDAQVWVPAIKHNCSLRALEIEDCDDDENRFGDMLGIGLFYNRSIQEIHLKACHPLSSSLGFLLATSQLKQVRLTHCELDARLAASLAAGLKSNTSLRVLDLTGNGLDDEAITTLAEGVARSQLDLLTLDFNAFGDVGVAALSNMLAHHPTLRELHLFGNRVTGEGARHLAAALRTNSSLSTLILSFNQIGDSGAVALAEALTVNTTLTQLWFPSNSVGASGIEAFARYLPEMNGLEQLNVGMLLDDKAAEALASALKENLRLSVLYMEKAIEDEQADKDLEFYLRLNRSGRRILRDKHAPPGLWADLLANASRYNREDGVPDVLHYLLREQPQLLERAEV